MKMISHRDLKVSRELKRQVSWIIQYHLQDPRLKNIIISVSTVKVSRDFNHAKVYTNIFNMHSNNICKKFILNILQCSSKFIRFLLAKHMVLRITPFLQFIYDNSYEKGRKITNLISNKLKQNYSDIYS